LILASEAGGLAVRYAQQEPAKVGACGVFYGKPLTEGARGLPPVFAVFGGTVLPAWAAVSRLRAACAPASSTVIELTVGRGEGEKFSML